jgi:AcrR family transcriptional regulator
METIEERPLTNAQEARRQRVIDAAMELALEGGYEAVQMRDVATRADVAMGTVYRYFSSKDHLLAASLVYWAEQLEARLAQHPAKGATPAERVTGVLDRALRSLARQPRLGAAVFMALSSSDRGAVEAQMQITGVMESIVVKAIGEPAPSDVMERSRMIGHIWYSAMTGWVNGWSSVERVHAELEIAADLLLPSGLAT